MGLAATGPQAKICQFQTAMTSIDTGSPWIALTVTGGPILVGTVNIVYGLYLSNRHLDAMRKSLKNSRFIFIGGPGWRSQGWVGGVSQHRKSGESWMKPGATRMPAGVAGERPMKAAPYSDCVQELPQAAIF
jgi:hypothetical protein